MKFLLHISAGPESPIAEAALRFAEVTRRQQTLCGLFFSGQAVHTFDGKDPANKALAEAWLRLLNECDLRALCCSAASDKVLDSEALPGSVEIAGLGQLVELGSVADRTISFSGRGD